MYCQVHDVKQSLDIIGSTHDDQIREHIVMASDWIDTHCMYYGVTRPFAIPGDTTRYFDMSCVRSSVLHMDAPFISITSMVNGDGLTIPTAGYKLLPRNHSRFYQVKLTINYIWQFNDSDSEIAITGKFGYSELPPAPVVEACRHLSGWLLQRWQAGLNASSATTELGTTRQVMDVPEHVVTLLAPYVDRRKML